VHCHGQLLVIAIAVIDPFPFYGFIRCPMRMARLASTSVALISVATSGSSDFPFSRISLATRLAYFESGRCAVSGAIMQVVDFARRANLSRVGAIDFGRKSPAKSVHPGPHRGTFRDRHGRRVGMRWTQAVPKTRAHPADGEVVWS
jgi:hypothetical protein